MEYLGLNHDNAEMNEFAKRRIAVLEAENRRKTSESVKKLVNAIFKEIRK